ncbi:MAG: hypothetical protein HFJ11_00260 [Bacilli bacterium]|nr:hypothetical protein [Bacilli bacterium]
MEEKMIEVVVKESNIDNIPQESSDEGKKLIQTIKEESISSQKENSKKKKV